MEGLLGFRVSSDLTLVGAFCFKYRPQTTRERM